MKRAYIISSLLAAFCVWALAAASVDGRWVAKIENKKKGSQELVLSLKSDGDRLTGTVSQGRRGRAAEITDGKINGDTLTFTTTTGRRKQQAVKQEWTAKVVGNELKGTRRKDGARRGQPFTAVRR